MTTEAQSPLDYMLSVLNNPLADEKRRDQMAIAAAPSMHSKPKELGKKEAAHQSARTAGEDTEWGDDLRPSLRIVK